MFGSVVGYVKRRGFRLICRMQCLGLFFYFSYCSTRYLRFCLTPRAQSGLQRGDLPGTFSVSSHPPRPVHSSSLSPFFPSFSTSKFLPPTWRSPLSTLGMAGDLDPTLAYRVDCGPPLVRLFSFCSRFRLTLDSWYSTSCRLRLLPSTLRPFTFLDL